MDIEGSEWSALAQMITSGALDQVRQLYIEYHNSNVRSSDAFVKAMEIFRQLYEHGFRVFWTHPNEASGNQRRSALSKRIIDVCYEVYYVNTKLN